ncbi:MAG: CRISPR-associated endonuclease Cas2 [Candidatus Harrisonbacteria bacterium CG10_big_fil_rev_8_21_14_0_10_49_15]|uniref:CRISPR-associated endonuclease Cas2 n=1 Tax=Candidatus Harrisonbacteria bacterium CG10_big_fil_rev_8_21_14_0_10_49_15 TaxID=1974587 RepID=A0A2H0ULN4_9BACT|nr:MAG: CRISPR-associated endonuclease Cas2 [Candidatus Harrisonbacteria bacterium CG10_big_fil_rev_8_21_14_0_10_49_15]
MKDFKKKDARVNNQGAPAVLAKAALILLIEGGMSAIDFTFGMMDAGYGASRGQMERSIRSRRSVSYDNYNSEVRRRRQVSNLKYRLKRDGLISEVDRKGKRMYIITSKGKSRLLAIGKNSEKPLYQHKQYEKVEGDGFILVTYDIPEKRKRARDWLRYELQALGYKMVQKSVWMGTTKIPIEFIDDLKLLNLFDNVEFLQAVKMGSLSG